MKPTRFAVPLVAVAVVALATACASGPAQTGGGAAEEAQQVTVDMRDFSFSPPQVTVEAGGPVNLTVTNSGAVRHDWEVDLGGETVKVAADPGQSQSVTFTPPGPGTFEVLCTEPGHEAAGMKGTLVVN